MGLTKSLITKSFVEVLGEKGMSSKNLDANTANCEDGKVPEKKVADVLQEEVASRDGQKMAIDFT